MTYTLLNLHSQEYTTAHFEHQKSIDIFNILESRSGNYMTKHCVIVEELERRASRRDVMLSSSDESRAAMSDVKPSMRYAFRKLCDRESFEGPTWRRKVDNWRRDCGLETMEEANRNEELLATWYEPPQLDAPLPGSFLPLVVDEWPTSARLPPRHGLTREFRLQHNMPVVGRPRRRNRDQQPRQQARSVRRRTS